MLKYIKAKVLAVYNSISTWFKNSETILLARGAVAFGFVYAGLMATDWTQLMAMNFADGISKAEAIEAIKWVMAGFAVEYARRRNAPDMK